MASSWVRFGPFDAWSPPNLVFEGHRLRGVGADNDAWPGEASKTGWGTANTPNRPKEGPLPPLPPQEGTSARPFSGRLELWSRFWVT
eukprot:4388284-Alexandrium_andersonii.AAC.1